MKNNNSEFCHEDELAKAFCRYFTNETDETRDSHEFRDHPTPWDWYLTHDEMETVAQINEDCRRNSFDPIICAETVKDILLNDWQEFAIDPDNVEHERKTKEIIKSIAT